MTKIGRVCLLVVSVFMIGSLTACNRYAVESIDRTVVARLVEVDRGRQDSILKFINGTTVAVSNGSLSHWNTDRLIAGAAPWVFSLHRVNDVLYDAVSITDQLPLGGPTTTPIPTN